MPNDSQGEVLVSVQLIPTDGRKLAVKEDDIDIKPPTRVCVCFVGRMIKINFVYICRLDMQLVGNTCFEVLM